MNELAYNTDLTVNCIMRKGNYLAICLKREKEKNRSVATSIQQPHTHKSRGSTHTVALKCVVLLLLLLLLLHY